MTVYDHIRELRMRFFVSITALGASSFVIYLFYGQILKFLCSPLGAPLYYSNPAGSFSFVMKICFTGALIVTIPILTYNAIMFAKPAFEKYLPKKRIIKTTLASTGLAISGAIFAFFCILPGTLSFFKGFQVNGLSALISADSYLNFVTNIIITFVIVFQIPLIISFIDHIKPIEPQKLFKMEKWVILGSLVIALITPFTYDLLTSLLIALPIIVLYNLSIITVITRRAKARREAHQKFCANIAQAKNQPTTTPSQISFEGLANELNDLEKSNQKTHNTPPKPAMDIMSAIAQKDVVPADWVLERKRRQMELSKQQVQVLSDIRRKTNHVLASQ